MIEYTIRYDQYGYPVYIYEGKNKYKLIEAIDAYYPDGKRTVYYKWKEKQMICSMSIYYIDGKLHQIFMNDDTNYWNPNIFTSYSRSVYGSLRTYTSKVRINV